MKISKKIIRVIWIACMMMFSSIGVSAAIETKGAKLMTYAEWKTHTRQEIQKKIHFFEQKLAEQKEKKKPADDNLMTELHSEKVRLEASEDLSYHEYFLSYLAEQKDLDSRIAELAKILKPEEVKELIGSYATIIKKKKIESEKQGYASDPLED